MLYMADEAFVTGTAAELTPIRSIDRIPVGSGDVGPISRLLQQEFLEVAHGRTEDSHGWLTYCTQPDAVGRWKCLAAYCVGKTKKCSRQ